MQKIASSKKYRRLNQNQSGLTIVETSVAIAIFGFLVVFCLGMFIFVGRIYYKGIYENNTQEVVRNVVVNISESIRTSGVSVVHLSDPSDSLTHVPRSWEAYCIGNIHYAFKRNTQLILNEPLPVPPPLSPEPRQSDQVFILTRTDSGCEFAEATPPTGVVGILITKKYLILCMLDTTLMLKLNCCTRG